MSISTETSIATPPETSIEQRLAALEAAIAEIRQQLASPPKPNWLDQISGSMKDEPAFEEVVALGRAFRIADRPPQDEGS